MLAQDWTIPNLSRGPVIETPQIRVYEIPLTLVVIAYFFGEEDTIISSVMSTHQATVEIRQNVSFPR